MAAPRSLVYHKMLLLLLLTDSSAEGVPSRGCWTAGTVGSEGFDGDEICSGGTGAVPDATAGVADAKVVGRSGAGPFKGLVARRTLYEPGWTSTWRTT